MELGTVWDDIGVCYTTKMKSAVRSSLLMTLDWFVDKAYMGVAGAMHSQTGRALVDSNIICLDPLRPHALVIFPGVLNLYPMLLLIRLLFFFVPSSYLFFPLWIMGPAFVVSPFVVQLRPLHDHSRIYSRWGAKKTTRAIQKRQDASAQCACQSI